MTSTPHDCQKAREPETCSPEQIRECHGDAEGHSCEEAGCDCATDPQACTPEQSRECHGDEAGHPCVDAD